MNTGDLVFVRSGGFVPDLIRYFDKGRFNHVAIAVSPTEIVEAQYGTTVQVIKFQYTDYEVVPMNLTARDMPTFNSVLQRFLGEQYDLPELFRLWVKLVFKWNGLDKFNTPKEVICSELAGYFLMALRGYSIDVTNMSPNELYKFLKQNPK